jgi:hypothetical protein
MAYYALFVPKNIVVTDQVLPDQILPLTNCQIEAAWPNLPTAQEIVNGSWGYSLIDSSMPGFNNVKNYTWISPVNAIQRNYPSPTPMFVTRLVPVEYFIYEKLNDTTWYLWTHSTWQRQPIILHTPCPHRSITPTPKKLVS